METWLIILTVFTIVLVLFAFINIFIFFLKTEHDKKAIIEILPIDDCKKYPLEVLPDSISSSKKLNNYFKDVLKERNERKRNIIHPTEATREENLQLELTKLKDSLKKGTLKQIKLNTIKGIGKRTIDFLHLNNIDTLGDLINLAEVDKTIRDNIIFGLPGLNSESKKIKQDKFAYFVKQAQENVDAILNTKK